MKKITTLFIISILSIANVIPSVSQEEWEQDMKKEFAKVLSAKNDRVNRHRDFIADWREKEHLTELTQLYELEKVNRTDDAAFIYALGYAYALTEEKDNREAIENAATNFKTAITLDPSMFWAHYSLGALYQRQQKYEEALTKFQTSLSLNPKYYPAYYYIGEIQIRQGKHDEALNSFEIAQVINPKWVYPVYGRGLVYLNQGNLNRARETFERAIQNNRKFAPAYVKLGQVLAMEGFFDDALMEYQKSAEYQPYTATDIFDLADIFAEADNTDGAIQLYHRTLEIDPNYGPAHLAVADELYVQGDTDTAVVHYKKAIDFDPTLKDSFFDALRPHFIGKIGVAEARLIMEKAMAVLPDDPRSHFFMGKIEADSGNPEKAIEHYNRTLEIVEVDPGYLEMELPDGHFNDTYLKLGDLYRKQNDLTNAAKNYRRALELNPTLVNRFKNEGVHAFEVGNYENAIVPLSIHLILYPEDIDATYLLGQSYDAKDDKDNALIYYEKTFQLDTNHTEALYKMADIYQEKDSHQLVIETLKRVIAVNANDAQAHYKSALAYLALNQSDAALSSLIETVRIEPDNVAAQYQIGLLYQNREDINKAIVYFEKTIELNPDDPEPFFRLGGIYEKRQDEDNMIRVYQPALLIDSNQPDIHHKLASIFEKRFKKGHEENRAENLQQALHHYGLANEHDPEHFEWHYNYGLLLDEKAASLEDYHKHAGMAVKEYTDTIALKPDFVDAYFRRAMLTNRYKRIGEELYLSAQIIEDFKQVVMLKPDYVDAYFQMGTLQVWTDNFELAEENFQKVLQFNPKYKGVHTELGKLAEREKDWKRAIQLYEKEIEIDDKATTAYQRLGDLYYNSEMQLNKAKAILEKALALNDKHVHTIIVYANVLYSMDRLGAASEQFERVLQLESSNLTANFNLALMYEYTERYELAKTQWKTFLKLDPPEQWKLEAEKHLKKLAGN